MKGILLATKAAKLCVKVFTGFVLIFLAIPLVTMLSDSFAGSKAVILSFPPKGFGFSWYYTLLTDPDFARGIWVSLPLGVTASVCSLLVAVTLVTALKRFSVSGGNTLRSYALSPLIVPEVVIGVAMLQVFRALGLFGSFFALVLAHVVITMPYSIRILEATILGVDASLEDAARTLGANEFQVFRRVTFPSIQAGLVASLIFGFVTSLNDISMTAFLITPNMTTVSMVIFGWSTELYTPILAAASGVITIATFLFLMILDRTIGIDKATAFVAYR
jgi:putative spermidine/putrescine transport system permease protein